MIILDSDHLSVLKYSESAKGALLASRMRATADEFCTTIITVEEQMRGWLAHVRRFQSPLGQVTAYAELAKLLTFFGEWSVLQFDAIAATEFDSLRKQRVRIGTMDLKIAAIALSNEGLLLSANLRDFGKVPGLRVENWLD